MTPVTTDKDDEKTPEEPNDWWHFLRDSKIREGVTFEGRLARGGADSKLVSSSPRSRLDGRSLNGKAIGLVTGSERVEGERRGASHQPTAALLRDTAYKNSLKWNNTHAHIHRVVCVHHQVTSFYSGPQQNIIASQ